MEKWRFCFFSLALSPCVARPFPSLLLLFPKLWIELKLQAGRVAAGRKPAVLATKFILRVCGCPLIYATPLICRWETTKRRETLCCLPSACNPR